MKTCNHPKGTKRNLQSRAVMAILHGLRIVDALSYFLTLSFYETNLSATFLFSDFVEDLNL